LKIKMFSGWRGISDVSVPKPPSVHERRFT
jgi:hypothetical protein